MESNVIMIFALLYLLNSALSTSVTCCDASSGIEGDVSNRVQTNRVD
jgi:hypothetical protein